MGTLTSTSPAFLTKRWNVPKTLTFFNWFGESQVTHSKKPFRMTSKDNNHSMHFSNESKVAIMDAGNIEISEIVNVEPKCQCKVCLNHCSTGVRYCVCGRLMTKDSAENRKYISAILDTFSIPNFYFRKNRPHGHRYGKSQGCKEYYTANQLAKKCRKKKYDSITTGSSRQDLQKGDDWSWSLRTNDHRDGQACEWGPHLQSQQGRNWILPWQLVIHTNVAHFEFSTHKVRTRIQKFVVNNATPEASRGQKEARNIGTNFLILVFLALAYKLVGVWFWALASKMVWPLIAQGNLYFGGWISICGKSLTVQKNLEFLSWKSVTADGSLLSPTGGVKGMYLAPHIHEHLRYTNGYGKLRTSSRTTWTCLSTLPNIGMTPQCTLTRTLRSSEHAAHRL